MPDVRERLHRLAGDVAGLPRPPAAEVRRRAERRRRNERAGGVAVVAVAVLATAATAAYVRDEPPARLTVVPSESLAASPTSPVPSPVPAATPWLPAPWMLESARSSTWAAGQPSPYAFCGHRYRPAWSVAVREQTLVHPDGRRALLLELYPAPEDPMQLFKWSYSSCLVEGRAESVGGPRNTWSYDRLAGASEPAGATLRLVEITGPSERDATRRDAEAALNAWSAR